MPDSGGGICHFIGNKCDAVVARIRFDLFEGCSGPSHDCRLGSHRCGGSRKGETSSARNRELAIGNIVIHVALPWMRLAPGVLVWSYVVSFGKVGRTAILGSV